MQATGGDGVSARVRTSLGTNATLQQCKKATRGYFGQGTNPAERDTTVQKKFICCKNNTYRM
jgi:hypothetical protein